MDPVFFYRNPETAPEGGPGAGPEAAGATTVEPGARTSADRPLQGLCIAVQPTISVKGWPTEAGSNALAGYTALEDATVVRRLREAGAHLCGSTHASEFGFGLTGNRAGGALRPEAAGAPPGPSATPPAVRADAELVLDSMGESRVAAARASVCGLKPSYGLVSRFGLIGLIPSMECCGVLAERPSVIRAIMNTIAGQDDLDFSLPDEEASDLSHQDIDPQQTTIGIISETSGA